MLYKNKYRTESTRLKNWDYSSNGYYFVTICTQNRTCFFGEIIHRKMVLNTIGELAKKQWQNIPKQFTYATIDAYVIMPNHIHRIVVIDQPVVCRDAINQSVVCRDAINRVSTNGGITKNHNPMLHNNLSRIIRWFKGRTTFESRKIDLHFSWQPRFYDHIIRNEKSLKNIQQYINNNPKMWSRDRNNKMGLKI